MNAKRLFNSLFTRLMAAIMLVATLLAALPVDVVLAAHSYDTKVRFMGAGNPITQNYTLGAGSTLLVVSIVADNTRTGGAPTYNGIALTQAGTTRAATETETELWYLVNPPTGAAYQIRIPNTGTDNLSVIASSYKAQTGYTSALDATNGANNNFSANPSVSVTTTANGDIIVGAMGNGNTNPPSGRTGTNLFETDDGSYSDNGQYYLQTTAGTYAMGWTVGADDWGVVVAAFKEVRITTTAITSHIPDPSVVGQSVAVSFNVTGSSPTGNVTISDGTNSCTGTLVAGAGSCNLTLTTAGSRTLTATYAGDANNGASTSTGVTHIVNKADTTTTITNDTPDPSVVGQAYTVTASVSVTSPGTGTPTGTVTVSDGAQNCTITLPATTCNLTSTTAGAKTLTATYNGNTSFNASSTSIGVAHTVNKANTTTTITNDTPDPSFVNQPYTVTATVATAAPGSGTPTGTITVSDGAGATCTITLPATTCSLTSTSSGAKTLTATYNGDANYNTSTSAGVAHGVSTSYTITLVTGTGGTIQSPYGTVVTGSVVMGSGTNRTFYFVPNTGFIVSEVVDGGTLGPLNELTISGVSADHTVSVTFDGGWTAPTTNILPGGSLWQNPANVYTSNNVYATQASNAQQTVDYTTFGINIPTGSTIDGIEAAIEGYSSGRQVTIQLSGNNGGSWTLGSVATNLGGTDQTTILGNPTDLWGIGWTPASFNAAPTTFRVKVLSTIGGIGPVVYLDQLQVKVHYRQPTTLVVSAATGTYGGTVNLTGTLTNTVGGAGVSGQTITFYLNGVNKGTAVTNASGVATLNNVSLAGINAGTYNGAFNTSGVAASYSGTDPGVLPGYIGDGSKNSPPGNTNVTDITNNHVANTLTVNQAAITVTADNKSKTYGDADPALTYQITSGALVGSDTFTGAITRAAGEAVGPYAISQGTLALNTNYALTFDPGTLTIGQRPIAITADDKSKVYGDADPALTYQITSGTLAFSDAFTGSLTRVAGEDVGSYAINQGTLALNSNYALAFTPGTLTIGQRAITVTVDNQSKAYGDADPALTYQITSGSLGFTDTFTGALTRAPGETVGSYAITQDTLALTGNYNLTVVPGSLTIGQRAIEVTADNKSKTYGDADPALTYQITSGSLAFSDAFTGNITRDPGEAAGTYAITQDSLALDGNYALTFVPGSLTIGQRAIEVTADNQSKTYGDADPALTYQITGGTLVGSDAFTGAITRDPGEAVGSYAITQGTLTLGGNYDLTFVDGTLTIGQRAIEITADDQNKIYGDADPALTYQITSGTLAFSDTISGSLTRAAGEAVGSYAINQGTLALSGNYDLTFVDGTLTIGQRAIEVTADNKSKTYGDADPALTYQITGGSLGFSDSFTGALTRDPGEAVGSYAITQGSLALDSNYDLTFVDGTLTIGQRAIEVTADDKSKTYGDADPALTYQITSGSLGFTDTFTGAITRDPGEAAGTYAITQGSLALDGNYALTFVDGTLTINQRAITVTADDQSKTYGAADPTLTYQITSGTLAFSDAFTGSITRDPGEAVGSYAITQGSLLLSGNYALTFVDGTLTIGQRAITITADNQSKTYGDADPALTYQITSGVLQPGDTFSGSLTRAAGESVGSYAINQGSLLLSGNYDLTFVPGNLTIGQRAIEVTADNQSKTYGDADPTLTYQITSGSLAFSDAFTGSITRAAGEAVGSYAITQGSLALDGNYALTFVPGNLTIGQRAIEVTADDQNKTYGDADPALTYQITSGSLGFSDSFTGALTRAAGEAVGSYAITQGSLTLSGNYALTFVPGSLTIGQRAIEVTADNKGKTYGAADPALTYQITSGSLGFSDAFTGALTRAAGENIGAYAITQGSLALSGNYTLSFVPGTLTIGQQILTVTASGLNKVYDGTTNANVIISDNRVTGDDVIVAYTDAQFDTKNVGIGKPVTVSGISIIGGASAGNYTLGNTSASTSADITARPITVVAVSDTKVYDGGTSSVGIPVIVVGTLASGDTANFAQTFDTATIGNNKVLTPSGKVLDGNSGNNYAVTMQSVNTGVIAGAVVTVTGITASDKTYDGNTTATINTLSATLNGVASGDSVTLNLAGAIGTFDTRNVGNNKVVTISGLTLSGTNAGNYTLVPPTTTASITKRNLVVSATGQNKAYDGSPVATVTLSDDRVTGDTLAIAYGSASFADKNVGNGKTVSVNSLSVTGLDAGNYNFNTTAATTANITPRLLTVTAVADTKNYDGFTTSAALPILSSGSIVVGDSLTLSQTFNNKNVGTGKTLTPSAAITDGFGGNNYAVTIVTNANGVINAIPLTITGITVNNKVYDSTTAATVNTGSANLSGKITGDIVNLDTSSINGQFANKNVGNGKAVTITGIAITGTDSSNYTLIPLTSLTANILVQPISVRAAADTKVYDGLVTSSGVPTVISGTIVGSDTPAFTQTFDTSAAGTGKTLTATGFVNDGNGGNNYAVTFSTNTGTISRRPITVTANAQSKVVGASDPTLTYSITSGSLVAGDSLTGALTRVTGESVGSYPILQDSLSAGTNYDLTFIGANLTITNSNQVINVTTPAPASAVYNGSFTVTATATSGLPVIITATGDCGGSGNGSATITMTSGTGSCTVHYNQPGDTNYSAATEVLNTVNAQKASQTITPTTSAPASAVYNTTFNVAATASSGLTVSFSASGSCTNLGNIFTMSSGTGTCTVQYDQAGNANYLAAPSVIEAANAQKASQAINITASAPASAPLNASFTVAATTTSGLTVNYSASGICTNAGATFTMNSGSGTCTVQYSQPGDNNYSAAPTKTESVTANNGSQVINVTTHAPSSEVYNNSFTVVATSTSALPVNIAASGSCTGSGTGNASITMTSGSGTCTVTYTQPGDANYSAATPVTEFTTAQKTAQTITVNPHAPATSPNGTSFNVAATASSGLPVSITVIGACTGSGTSSANLSMNSTVGTCTVQFNQPGNANYLAATEVTETTSATALPVVTQQPTDTTAIVGGTATFTATAVGNPTPTVQWQVSTDGGNTFTDLSGATSTTLTVTASAADNGNQYRAVFTNTEGTTNSDPADLTIDTVAPTVITNGITSINDTGDGHLDEMEITSVVITKLVVRFSEAMRDPAGNSATDDVTNPANYLLIKDNGDGIQTVSCSAGITGGDIAVTVDSVAYNTLSYAATLTVNGNSLLTSGVYRLIVCGTTSVADVAGNKLAGNGSTAGTDFARNFVIARADGGGNNGGGNNGNSGSNNTSKSTDVSNLLIPVTGFTPGIVTGLPAQTADQAYAAFSGLVIEIPRLKVKVDVVGVPSNGTSWDVSWLGNSAGYLEGSAFPTTLGNSIITAHVWDANNNPGTFYGLKNLKYGDRVLIHAWGKVYTYEIRTQSLVLPGSIKSIWTHETLSWVTLVTCEDYNEKTDKYTFRRVVRAVLVSVTNDK